MWPDRRLLDRLGLEFPIIQSPMGGAVVPDLAIAVSEAGGLGSLACSVLPLDRMRGDIGVIRQRTAKPLNANFFARNDGPSTPERDAAWVRKLAPYYAEFGLQPPVLDTYRGPRPFDEDMCAVVEELRPEVVSFHVGLPAEALMARLKAAGCFVISTATTVAEARWLEAHGADAVIAQGFEAGGHRGMFLTSDLGTQLGTLALIPQVVDTVSIPVIAAGGVGDGRGLAAVLVLGAAAAQIGTAFLQTPEAGVAADYRAALRDSASLGTTMTNVFTGRAARTLPNRLTKDVGPMSPDATPFPSALRVLAPILENAGTAASDFAPFWSGQAAPLGRAVSAGDFVMTLAADAQRILATFR